MTIEAKRLFDKWQKDPAYREAYEALEAELSRAKVLVEARTRAGLTQAQLAKRMGTTQLGIARIESGRQKPSFATLERYARATGHELRIELVPVKKRAAG